MADAAFEIGTSSEDGAPVFWRPTEAGSLGVYGAPQTGKTTFGCRMVQQAAQNPAAAHSSGRPWDIRVIEVVDGGSAYTWARSAWIASNASDAVFVLDDIGKRVRESTSPPNPVLLVVDEASVLSSAKTNDNFDAHSLVEAAASIAGALKEGPALDIYVVLMAAKRPVQWATPAAVALGKMSARDAMMALGVNKDLDIRPTPQGLRSAWYRDEKKRTQGITVPNFEMPA